MKVPPELSQRLLELGAKPPAAAVRALYDLEGNLGETWAITDGDTLFLFSKRIGQAFRLSQHPLKAIDDLAIREDGSFAWLQVLEAGRKLEMKFSVWDRHDLDAICRCWSEVSGRPARNGTRHLARDVIPTAHAPAQPLTPLTAFCAAIHAMARADGSPDPTELLVLLTAVRQPTVIDRGREWLEQHDDEALFARLPELLNEEQKLCLLANAAAVGMADGLWRTAEQRLLERLRHVLGVPETVFQPVFDVLMIQHTLHVFEAGTPEQQQRALELLAAALHAMSRADGEVSQEELAVLWHLVEDPGATNTGANLLEQEGVDGVIAQTAATLSGPQGLCLLTNLLKVAMVDGVLRSKEQALAERFRQALRVTDGTWQAIHHALMVKNNLAVFAV
jgi:tellurite resistance protein